MLFRSPVQLSWISRCLSPSSNLTNLAMAAVRGMLATMTKTIPQLISLAAPRTREKKRTSDKHRPAQKVVQRHERERDLKQATPCDLAIRAQLLQARAVRALEVHDVARQAPAALVVREHERFLVDAVNRM